QGLYCDAAIAEESQAAHEHVEDEENQRAQDRTAPEIAGKADAIALRVEHARRLGPDKAAGRTRGSREPRLVHPREPGPPGGPGGQRAPAFADQLALPLGPRAPQNTAAAR